MKYNNIYKQNQKVWGQEPNKLLQMIWQKVKPKSYFLDLGCGQGRDSVFMAKQRFKVVAIDESKEAIEQLRARAVKENLKIETICQSIADYKIVKDKFSIINAYNIFQFLDKGKTGEIIDSIKKNLKPAGYAIISGFTVSDSLYLKQENKSKGYFSTDELRELFNNFEIIFYFEGEIVDKGHAGANLTHKHNVVRIIVRKF
ncbi:MAG: class I SAM-dependent methyltransferase [Patescibacteria group bacterium]